MEAQAGPRNTTPETPTERPAASNSSIRDLVAQVLKQYGIGADPGLRRAVASWRSAVGAESFEHTSVVGLKKGVLVVDVDSAALLQELSVYRKRELLIALKQAQAAAGEPTGESKGEPKAGSSIFDVKFRLAGRSQGAKHRR